jgi:hypothetical protein
MSRRTRGHAFVVMLAYKISQELATRWRDIDTTVAEGIHELTTLCATELLINGHPRCNCIPQPRRSAQKLLEAAGVRLPQALPCKGVHVATRKKLPGNRISSLNKQWLKPSFTYQNKFEHPLKDFANQTTALEVSGNSSISFPLNWYSASNLAIGSLLTGKQ